MSAERSEVLQGTLDLMILKTLHALGPLHGFGIARRLEQLSEEVLKLNEGTVYTSLLRLQQQGWIVSEWGASENNRKARFYSITKRGLKQLAVETENWERISGVIGRVLARKAKDNALPARPRLCRRNRFLDHRSLPLPGSPLYRSLLHWTGLAARTRCEARMQKLLVVGLGLVGIIDGKLRDRFHKSIRRADVAGERDRIA